MDGLRVLALHVDSYQRLEKRSQETGGDPIEPGSEGKRRGFDGFDELLTTCAAVNRLLAVASRELAKERNSRNVFTE